MLGGAFSECVMQKPKQAPKRQYGALRLWLWGLPACGRLHNVPAHVRGRIPCPRKLSSFEVLENEPSSTGEAVHQAQQVTGELLWLSQRSRPDLAFTVSLLASLATKAPHRALRIADRALGNLQRTKAAPPGGAAVCACL